MFEPLESRRLLAATPQLVADLLPPEAGYNPNQISQLKAFNGDIYFVAEDGSHGFELWKSDGTGPGTELVKDIAADSASSFPVNPVVSNGSLFFTADDGINGRALWKTNGTEAGTVMVKDIDPATVGGEVSSLIDLNGTLYFYANDGSHGAELWRSDGTPEGTWMVKDIFPDAGSSTILSLLTLNGILYFSADDGSTGFELWRSDGTEQGTWRVKDIWPGANTGCFYLAKGNGQLFLNGNDGLHGAELWKSDGTEAGTMLVKEIHSAGNSSPSGILDVDGTIFFAATHSVDGTELWKSDGTEAGTVQVKNIRFLGSSLPNLMMNYDGIAIFTANDGTNGREVWRSDGTSAGTFRISNISAGDAPFIGYFVYQDGLLYFSADSGSGNVGTELYVTNGTLAGTQLVADIYPGTPGSSPSQLTLVEGVVYFAAANSGTHYQLWKLPDEIAPRVVSSSFDYQTGHRISIKFTEDVSAALLPGDVQVQQLPGGPIFTPDSVQFDPVTRTATCSFISPLPDGNYRATLSAGTVEDPTGHALTSAHTFDLFVLAGDANRDRMVDIRDLSVLALNWQGSGKAFADGDFNYDGRVDALDLGILSSHWQQTLAPPPPAQPILLPLRSTPTRSATRVVSQILA